MKTIYLQQLKKEIRLHSSIIQDDSFSKEKWTKGNFKLCSKIIGQALLDQFTHDEMISYGTTISYKTIENLFKNKYVLKNPMDPRSLCTLTKLVKFVGYNSWSDFTETVDLKKNEQIHLSMSDLTPKLTGSKTFTMLIL